MLEYQLSCRKGIDIPISLMESSLMERTIVLEINTRKDL
jgi:hypothetical protein